MLDSTAPTSSSTIQPVQRTSSIQAQPAQVQPPRPTPLEQICMQDVTFLLKTMFNREEEIVRLILDSLYDVGSVNLINQRVHPRWLNQLAQWAARFSKPVFRVVAIRWVRKNCPKLISDWLYTQIKFEPKQVAQIAQTAEASTSTNQPQPLLAGSVPDSAITVHLPAQPEHTQDAASPAVASPVDYRTPIPITSETVPTAANLAIPTAQLEVYRREMQLLHSRVKLLTALLIGVTVTLGSGLAWSLSRDQMQTRISQPLPVEMANQRKLCPASLQPCP